MRALVLGGSGFIGSHLVDSLLLRDGDHPVRCSMANRIELDSPASSSGCSDFFLGDDATSAEAMAGIDGRASSHLVSILAVLDRHRTRTR